MVIYIILHPFQSLSQMEGHKEVLNQLVAIMVDCEVAFELFLNIISTVLELVSFVLLAEHCYVFSEAFF